MTTPTVRAFYDSDADRRRLNGRVIAVIGYGSQGHAHALNLKESGAKVMVGLRPDGASWQRAVAAGLDVPPMAEAAAAAGIIMMLVPDKEERAFYASAVGPPVRPWKPLMLVHDLP